MDSFTGSERPARRRARRLALIAFLLALAAWAAHGAGDRWFFWPEAGDFALPADLRLGGERVAIPLADGGAIDGWLAPAVGEKRGTVVYCHGNHAHLAHHARFVAWLPRRGFDLLLFDYRGFGRSAGTATRANAVADAVAAVDFALARDPDRTFVFGHSLGGACAIAAAARRPRVRAVVAESTFPSFRAAARGTAPALAFLVPWLVSAGDDPEDAAAALPPRPLLVVHGEDDAIAPVALGRELFAAAREPKRLWIVPGCGHATPWLVLGTKFEDEVCAFFFAAAAR